MLDAGEITGTSVYETRGKNMVFVCKLPVTQCLSRISRASTRTAEAQ